MSESTKTLAQGHAALAAGREALAEARFAQAIASGRAGLAALGDDYASPTVADDTELKLGAAEDLLRAGDQARAAALILRMLEIRIRLLEDKTGVRSP